MELSYKQYLLTNQALSLSDMKELPIEGGVRLYIGKDLPIRCGMTAAGTSYVLLGEAYCTDRFPREATEDLDAATDDAAFTITKFWTGRWALILGKELITDASGLMSVFYHEAENGWILSSSIALLSYQLGMNEDKRVALTGLTWSILPSTIRKAVKLLFCTQSVTLNSTLKIHFHNRFSEWRDISYEKRVKTITLSLVAGLKNIDKYSGRKLWIALTAGKDSRLTLAATLSAGVPFDTYTAKHRNISDADRHLPKEMSRKYGFTHHLLKKGQFSKAKYKEYCEFSCYNSLGADGEFYATGQFDMIPSSVVSIKSGLFEAGQTYARNIAGGEEQSFVDGMLRYFKVSFRDEMQLTAFYEWMEYQREHPMPGVDIRDRFYFEQRLNGWAAAIEQSLTINPFVSIQIANSAVVLGCLLYAPAETRDNLQLSYDLIRFLNPGLLDFPINQRTTCDRVRIVINGLKKRLHQ